MTNFFKVLTWLITTLPLLQSELTYIHCIPQGQVFVIWNNLLLHFVTLLQSIENGCCFRVTGRSYKSLIHSKVCKLRLSKYISVAFEIHVVVKQLQYIQYFSRSILVKYLWTNNWLEWALYKCGILLSLEEYRLWILMAKDSFAYRVILIIWHQF